MSGSGRLGEENMTKNEYLKQLRRALGRLRRGERLRSLQYFSELIDDKMEEGLSEEQAIAQLESVEAAALRILDEAKSQGQLKRRLTAWEAALLVLGFPVWFPLLLTAALVLITIYLLVWVLIAALFLCSVALGFAGLAGVLALLFSIWTNPPSAFAALGVGLASAGLGIASFIPLLYLSKAFIRVTPIMWNALFNKKGVL